MCRMLFGSTRTTSTARPLCCWILMVRVRVCWVHGYMEGNLGYTTMAIIMSVIPATSTRTFLTAHHIHTGQGGFGNRLIFLAGWLAIARACNRSLAIQGRGIVWKFVWNPSYHSKWPPKKTSPRVDATKQCSHVNKCMGLLMSQNNHEYVVKLEVIFVVVDTSFLNCHPLKGESHDYMRRGSITRGFGTFSSPLSFWRPTGAASASYCRVRWPCLLVDALVVFCCGVFLKCFLFTRDEPPPTRLPWHSRPPNSPKVSCTYSHLCLLCIRMHHKVTLPNIAPSIHL